MGGGAEANVAAPARRVVVTGATGNLGRKAVQELAAVGVDVAGLDLVPGDAAGPTTVVADLATYAPGWATAFAGADVVVHLAAEPRPIATWAQVQHANVDVSLNVLRAVEEHGVGRVVFASSNWVLGGYRFTCDALTAATPPRPINPYGYSKIVTERDCAALHARTGVDAVMLRLGWCQPGENRPGPHMAFGRWGQEMWLSNDDWCQAVVAACTVPSPGYEVVNVMSDNAGMRWDLSDTERVLGYRPRSRHTPRLTPRTRLTQEAARVRARWVRPITDAAGRGARW